VAEQAVVFDVMGTLFDLAPVGRRLELIGAPQGAFEAWFERVLHTAASLTLVGQFAPFREIARTALGSTLAQLGVHEGRADEVLDALRELDPYPDTVQSLELLAEAGIPAVALTNGGREQTKRLMHSAGLLDRVGHVLSVEDVRAYKPHPAPYRHAVETLGLPPESLTLIAAHGWDVIGAQAAGLAAVWVDRLELRWPFPTAEPRRAAGLVEAVSLALRPTR